MLVPILLPRIMAKTRRGKKAVATPKSKENVEAASPDLNLDLEVSDSEAEESTYSSGEEDDHSGMEEDDDDDDVMVGN